MYKYLVFDLDDTLLDFKAAEAVAIRQALEEFGIDPTDKTVELYSAINLSYWKAFERGEIDREEIFEGRFHTLSSRLGVPLDTVKISRRYFKLLSCQGIVFKDAIPLLKKLKGKYVLAAATNGESGTQTNRLIASGISGFFEGGIYISGVMGYKKPQKEYFDLVLKGLGNPDRKEVLMLGDSLTGDIAGGAAAGLDTCFVNLRGSALLPEFRPTYTVTSLPDILNILR